MSADNIEDEKIAEPSDLGELSLPFPLRVPN